MGVLRTRRTSKPGAGPGSRRHRRARYLLAGAVAATALGVAVAGVSGSDSANALTAAPAASASPPVVAPTMPCEQLTSVDFTDVQGAPTRVLSAAVQTDGEAAPYCEIKGYINPQIFFGMRLPTETWRQRYLQLGCGGLCGRVRFRPMAASGCAPLDDGTFATAFANQGHTSFIEGQTGPPLAFDGVFARNAPALRLDFGYRSGYVLSLAAKRIVKTFYGQGPSRSYFDGCSGGGRQALLMAQRYPEAFDGILAGAPGLNAAALMGEFVPWMGLVNQDEDGRPILVGEKLAPLHEAVLARCDGLDGLVDGQINDPRLCDFDPESIECPAGVDRTDCLTPAQVEVVRDVYSGPVDRRGRKLYTGSPMYGSELGWNRYVLPRVPGQPTVFATGALNWLKYMAFWDNPPASFTLSDYEFNRRSFNKLQRLGALYDATNPDLSAFRARGGKLIIWHHWQDPGMPPQATLNYYDALRRHNGGQSGVDSFVKLYMIPGSYHCNEQPNGDPSPGTFDVLTPLVDWVEADAAPGRVVASRIQDGEVTRTRPVFPYPRVARYDGSGSIDDATNFVGVTPRDRPDEYVDWIGGRFKPGQVWFTWRHGNHLVRTSKRPPDEL